VRHFAVDPFWQSAYNANTQDSATGISEKIKMNFSRLVFAVIGVTVALGAAWFVVGTDGVSQRAVAEEPAAGGDMQANLDRAVEAVVAAAKQGVQESQSPEEILQRTDMSVETLRLLGELGSSTASLQAEKLLDDVQASAEPQVAEVITRMRLARQLQHWSKMSRGDREKAIDRFVADVKKDGLTPSHADLVMRLADNLEMGEQPDLAKRAVTELIPLFQSSTEPMIQRRTPVMEGVVRRLDVIGKPLELEGKLLDGAEFDWESYRGKVVLVDFFANWCGVCREEVPTILQAYRAYHDKGFEVVGVSLDRQAQLAEQYRKQTGFQFPTLFSDDPRAMEWKSPLAEKYGVTSLPRAILVDQNGNVVDTVARGERLIQNLQDLLGPAGGAVGRRVGDLNIEPASETSESSGVVPTSFDDSVDLQQGAEENAAPTVPEE
jgi:thiol-disulfide isomerase/thioredoxin